MPDHKAIVLILFSYFCTFSCVGRLFDAKVNQLLKTPGEVDALTEVREEILKVLIIIRHNLKDLEKVRKCLLPW